MSKNPFSPYNFRTVIRYAGLGLLLLFFQSYILTIYGEVLLTRPILLQLGRVMGGAFAFVFSIGTYLAERSEDVHPRDMPLFHDSLLMYILMFVLSILLPFTIHSSNLTESIFISGAIFCFNLSFICLAGIPFAYGMIQTRYNPSNVLKFLRNAAIDNMVKTTNYTVSWHHIIDITKVCNKIYEEDVDLFSAGIGHLGAILNKGIELYENRKVILLNGKNIPISEWIRLCQTRIIWIGEKVVENRYAFERLIVQVIAYIRVTEVIFKICYYLCDYAHKKGQIESLEIGLRYFIPWCKANNVYEECNYLEEALAELKKRHKS